MNQCIKGFTLMVYVHPNLTTHTHLDKKAVKEMRCRPILPYSAPPRFDQSHNSIAHTRWSDTPEAIKSGTKQGDQMELGNGNGGSLLRMVSWCLLVKLKPSILEPMHHSFQAGPPCIGLISISPPSRWKTDEVVDWGW